MTATNNALGGPAVSPENLEVVRELSTQHGALLSLDAARFAENAALVRRDSPRWGHQTPAAIALALPRRVHTQSHVDYVIAIAARGAARADRLRGLAIVQEPARLRHFTARLAPVDA